MRLIEIGLIITMGVIIAIIDVTPYLRVKKVLEKAKDE